MNDTKPTPVRLFDSGAVCRAEKFRRAFEERFRFAITWVTEECCGNPTFCAIVPRSYFEFRDRWLGYVVFGRFGTLVVVTEILPDNSHREVETRLGFDEPDFEGRILEIFQEVLDRG